MNRDEERRTIELAMAGDRSAAGALVRAHQRSLHAYIVRMCGRPDLAEDIVQEAFVRALTNIDRFDFRFRFSTWLFTIGRRLFLNYVQKMRPAYDSDVVGGARGWEHDPAATTTAQDTRDVRRAELDRALAGLSVEQREVLILFHQHEWPIALISAHTGMPEGTVKSHLHRGRRRLKDLLEADAGVHARLEWTTPQAVHGGGRRA